MIQYSSPLTPALHPWPKLCEGTELFTLAKKDIDSSLQSPGIVSGRAHILHVFPQMFQNRFTIVEDDHAVTGIAPRAPEKPALVTAEGRRQARSPAIEIDGPCLAIVLGEDAAVVALFHGNAIPGQSGFVHDLLPAELV